MRIASSSLVLALMLSVVAVPTADALLWSSFTATVNKYDVRAAVKVRKTKPRPASVALPAIAKGGLVFGDVEATTTIVMFTDIECPFCRRFAKDTYPTLKKEYLDTKKVRFVVRHFPLAFHPTARPAAAAIVCARAQSDDLARSLHDKLIALKTLDAATLLASIKGVKGLDAAKISACSQETATDTTIQADIDAGTAAKVAGTPSFLIVGPDGKKQEFIAGAFPIGTFRKAIDAVSSSTK